MVADTPIPADDGLTEQDDGGSVDDRAEISVPEWLAADPCPRWCLQEHPVDQHPLDRAHQLQPIMVPVIEDNGRPAAVKRPVGTEYVIDVRRYPGRPETWVYVGDETNLLHGFCLTLESAARLQWELKTALDLLNN